MLCIAECYLQEQFPLSLATEVSFTQNLVSMI